MDKKILLKDLLFNKTKVSQISKEIKSVYPAFKAKAFAQEVTSKFPELELKARLAWIAICLKKYLPTDYTQAVNILIQSLPAPNAPHLSDDDFGDFIYAPYTDFIAKNGCNKKDLAFSLQALKEITTRLSAEDAIRYFINAFPKETLIELMKWSSNSHYHVRRLCSEGTRPKLPWSQKIVLSVTDPLPILNKLFSDSTRFVTRSVANHLNDISKTHPEIVFNRLTAWQKSGKQKPKEMDYILSHSLRTLIKKGHPKAMELMGCSHKTPVRLTDFTVSKQVKIGSLLAFSFTVESPKDTQIIADYIIYFQNKASTLANKKVFKLKKLSLQKGQPASLSKQHRFRGDMTTRKLYPGRHQIEIQLNGKTHAKADFELV
jgi:3-methyladenine DNA glycosylase AlkC